MEKTLCKIANLLILNLQNINKPGLLNGKMGAAVFLYTYARKISQPAYNDQADNVLDEIFAALKLNLPHSLIDGSAGIGLGLNYLIKNHFIETDDNPDELFLNIDDQLSQNFSEQFRSDTKSGLPVFSACFYIMSRIKNEKRTSQKNKMISFLLTGIHSVYINKKLTIPPLFTNSVIYFLNGLYEHGIYKEEAIKELKLVLTNVSDHLSKTNYYPSDIDILQHLLISINDNASKLRDKITTQISQFNVIPEDNTNMDVVCRKMQQYMLYPDLDDSDFPAISLKEYVDNCIIESTFDFSLLPSIGLNLMGVKLC